MKEIVISKNLEEKKYRIVSLYVTKPEFDIHGDMIEKFNETPFHHASHYMAIDDYNEKSTVKHLFDSMDVIGFECSGNVLLPEFC